MEHVEEDGVSPASAQGNIGPPQGVLASSRDSCSLLPYETHRGRLSRCSSPWAFNRTHYNFQAQHYIAFKQLAFAPTRDDRLYGLAV